VTFTAWLIGQVLVIAFLVLVGTSALGPILGAKTIAALKRSGSMLGALYAGVLLADLLVLVWIGVVAGGLSGWVMVAAGLIVGAWVIWNWSAKRRLVVIDAETDIAGSPYDVSAFFANVREATRWQAGLVSSVEAGMSLEGPRFHVVGVPPGSDKEIAGELVLRVNEPGKEVVVAVEGAGLTADQYLLSPAATGTHVFYRTLLEVPFFMALAGGMFLAGDKDRPRRHVEELARAKAVFEAAHAEGS
jgi:hypothetical protein